MEDFELKVFVLGDLSTNCYLIFNKKTKTGFLIDTPLGSGQVKDYMRRYNIELEFIILTHGHFDHIGSLDDFPQQSYIHSDDQPFLGDPRLNGSLFFGSEIIVNKKTVSIKEGISLSFNSCAVEIIHTPGHTPGSICLRLNKWLFSGDTIFFEAIGRTDIPAAQPEAILKSIRTKIMCLPQDTIIYPGHGQSTTVAREKKYNPFCA